MFCFLLCTLLVFFAGGSFAQDYSVSIAGDTLHFQTSVGDSSVKSFQITNTSNRTLLLQYSTVSPNFQVQGNGRLLLAASSSGMVVVMFRPKSGGIFSGVLYLVDSEASLTIPLQGIASGPKALSFSQQELSFHAANIKTPVCKELFIHNPNDFTVTFDKISIAPNQDNRFSLANSLYKITAHSDTVLSICFSDSVKTRTSEAFLTIAYTINGISFQPSIELIGKVDDDILPHLDTCVEVVIPSMRPVMIGGYREDSITFYNPTNYPVIINDIIANGGDRSAFTVAIPAQVMLPAKDSMHLPIKFTPDKDLSRISYNSFYLLRTHADSLQCLPWGFMLNGTVLQNVNDSLPQLLFDHPQSYVLGLQSDVSGFNHLFHFKNNGSSLIQIDSIETPGDSIGIQTSATFPFTVTSGNTFDLSVTVPPGKPGFFRTILQIVTNGLPIAYEVQVLRTEKLAVLQQKDDASISIFPNPFTYQATIGLGNIDQPRIEVLDILGNLIISTATSQHVWQWDGKDQRGNSLANGTYFVRVTGFTPAGKCKAKICPVILAR